MKLASMVLVLEHGCEHVRAESFSLPRPHREVVSTALEGEHSLRVWVLFVYKGDLSKRREEQSQAN
jgi:hypothetical protein